MVDKLVVLQSINLDGGLRCVDIFLRADGSHGFRECRRDPEENRGWYELGGFSETRYTSVEDAVEAAKLSVIWLSEAINQT